MLDKNSIKYSYSDISIVPSVISDVVHRDECYPFYNNVEYEENILPIFAAPMSSVVNEKNYDLFEKNHIKAILPRNYSFETRLDYALNNKWAAFSLQEFEEYFCDEELKKKHPYCKSVLIDIANGHMKKMYELVRKAKDIHGRNIRIMIGNIANPETYYEVWRCGADYVRVGIGGGGCCITSSNTAIHYPQASLIDETYRVKESIRESHGLTNVDMPKIIADGGIRNYSDVIKALALGADYVMVGSLFGSLIESSGKMFTTVSDGSEIEIKNEDYDSIVEKDGNFILTNENSGSTIDNLHKVIYGMASKQGQIDINGNKNKTSEGIIKIVNVTTNLSKWTDNMIAYLKSAMSYLDVKTLSKIKDAKVILISNNAKNSINL